MLCRWRQRESQRGFTKFWEVNGSGDAVQSVYVEVSVMGDMGISGSERADDHEVSRGCEVSTQ